MIHLVFLNNFSATTHRKNFSQLIFILEDSVDFNINPFKHISNLLVNLIPIPTKPKS